MTVADGVVGGGVEVAAGVVTVRTGIDLDQALEHVQAHKPTADPLPHQREDLRRWWEGRQAG